MQLGLKYSGKMVAMTQKASQTLLVIAAILSFPHNIQAHEKWFHDAAAHPTNWAQAFKFPQIIGVTIALLITVVLGVVWRMCGRRNLFPGPEALGATPNGFKRFYALVP